MDRNKIVEALNVEIASLTSARDLLAGDGYTPAVISLQASGASVGRVRPKVESTVAPTGTKRSPMTAEGRAKVAEAMRKRWAARRKTAAKAVKK